MTDVMLDLETFGKDANAVVVQIGAAYFNRTTGEVGAKFKCNVDARSYMGKGFGKLDPDTIYWWLKQSAAAQASILSEPQLSVGEAFTALNKFLADSECVWSHATFDYPIVTTTLSALKIPMTFKYYGARDIRTLMDLSGYDWRSMPREGTHHDALDDALHQINYCVAAMQCLKRLS